MWSLGSGLTFLASGVLNIGIGGFFQPYIPPPAPLFIGAPGYPEFYAPDYIQPEGCGCVYVDNTYLYGQQQEEQGRTVFVPTSWTPSPVTQPAKQGLPPFITGVNPVPQLPNPSGLAAMLHRDWLPLVMWGGGTLIVAAIGAAYWVNRYRDASTYGRHAMSGSV